MDALLNRSNQKIEYRVLHPAMVRAESKLLQIAVHVLCRDVNVRLDDGLLEQPPEAFNVVHMTHRVVAIVVVGVFLRPVLDLTVLVAVAVQ